VGGGLKTRSYLYYIAVVALLFQCANGATVQVSSSLQAAIDAAAPGDVLTVDPGVYDKIEVTKSLNLMGNGAMIRADERDACVRVKADRVNISGFLVRDGFYGISLENVTNCNISGNTVVHCTQPGIMLKFSNDNIVEHNNASFNGLGGEGWYGIYLTNSNHNLIEANTAYGNGAYGINLFPSCNNNTIRGNILERNMYGLYMFTDCTGNLIESNLLSRNTNSGLDMRFNCHHNLILNNTIADNVVSGITLMEGSGKNMIRGNIISGNPRYGIQIQSRSDNNTLVNNNISSSQEGIFLESNGNHLYGNRLADNVVQAEDRGSNNWNAAYPLGGNMWSDYQGKDQMSGPGQDVAGADLIGDGPYSINDHALDRYPLMGNQVQPIKIIEKIINPPTATLGNNVVIEAKLESKYAIGSVLVHAVGSKGVGAGGYVRMVQFGDIYQGTLVTALMAPGKYDLELSAKDVRGNELKESIGEIEIVPRGTGTFSPPFSNGVKS
jgi:nitrous oxidase accessory protein